VFSQRRNTEIKHERTRERGLRMERAMWVVRKKMSQGEVEGQDSQELSELSQRSLIVSNRRGQGRKERHLPECSDKVLTQLQEIWVPY